MPLNTLAGEDRRRHGNQHLPNLETLADSRHDMINYCILGEQHVVPLRTSDKHGAQERDFHDRLLVKERSCSQTWWVAWGTWKVAGAWICSPYIQGSQAVLIMGDRIDQVTYEEYPEEMYPTNCHGTFYLFSALVRNKLLQVFFSFVNCILNPPL